MTGREEKYRSLPHGSGLNGALQYATLASPHIAIAAMTLSMTIFVPQYYAAATSISLAGVGLAFTIVRVADLLFDPMLGVVIDQVSSRFGRFRPWVVLGAPAVMVGAGITYFPPPDASLAYLAGGLVFFYAGQSLVTVTTFAWAALLTKSDAGRARVYGWIQTASMLGMLLALCAPLVLKPHAADTNAIAVHGMGLLILVAIPITVAAAAVFVAEPAGAPVSDRQPFARALLEYGRLLGRPAVLRIIGNTFFYALASGVSSSLVLFFAAAKGLGAEIGVLLIVYFGAAFASSRIWTPLTKSFGKHSVLATLCGGAVLVQLAALFLPQHGVAWAAGGQVILGVTYSGTLVLQRAALGDIADDIRHDGADVTGRLYAFYAFVTKIGVAGAVGVTFPLLQWIGFSAKATANNSSIALHRMELAAIMIPALLIGAAGLAVVGGDKARAKAGRT